MLKKYYDKTVCVTAVNNKLFKGKVTDYLSPEDNDTNEESIVIDDYLSRRLIEFPLSDIKNIKIIK